MLGRVDDEQNTARGKQVRHDFSSRGATNRIASPLRSARPARPDPAGTPDHGRLGPRAERALEVVIVGSPPFGSRCSVPHFFVVSS